MRLCQFSNCFTKNSSSIFLKLGKLNRKGIPDLWTLVKNCEFFQISSAMMHTIIIGCSGAIAMNLTVCEKQVEKQWRQQVIMITVHKFSYFYSNSLVKQDVSQKFGLEIFSHTKSTPKLTNIEQKLQPVPLAAKAQKWCHSFHPNLFYKNVMLTTKKQNRLPVNLQTYILFATFGSLSLLSAFVVA